MEFLKSLVAKRETVTAATVVVYDLPVNPLSHLDLDFELTLSAAYTQATLANIAAMITKLEVIFKGSSVIALSGADLWAYNAVLCGRFLPVLNRDLTVASIMLPRFRVPFGRYPFDGNECFPAVRRSELQLRITYAASFTAFATPVITITSTELLGAAPKQFMKATTLSKTPVVGDNDIDIPIGNKLLGLLGFSTTVHAGTAIVASMEAVKLLVDNIEHYYTDVRWPDLNQRIYEILGRDTTDFDHTHRENTATAYTQNGETKNKDIGDQFLANYGYLDFDPLRDNSYLFDTAGKSRVNLRVTAGDTNALRVIPIEIIQIGAAA